MVVSESVLGSPASRRRFEAMLGRVDAGEVLELPDDEVEARLEALGPREGRRRGGLAGRGRAKELVAFAHLGASDRVFPGYSFGELRSGRRERIERGVLCQTALEVQTAVGCPFDCAYCPYSSFLCVRLDVEALADRVVGLARASRSQALFKLNNRSDTLGLEPEYGLAPALVERFARLPDKALMLYSKGAAVDGLLDLDHRGRTVACFTLTPEPVAARLEACAPAPSRRLGAIRKLGAAGYPIRVRFSPIVPVRDWRSVYGHLVRRLAAAARPELVTLWTLSMVDLAELDRIVPLGDLDEAALEAARAEAPTMAGVKGAPFPPRLRAELYAEVAAMIREASPTTRVALCLETPEVWDRVGNAVVPRRGRAFLCNCGPGATPEAVAACGRRAPLRRRRPARAGQATPTEVTEPSARRAK